MALTLEKVIANCKPGWHVNEKVAQRIIERCNMNNGLCPCHHPENDGDLQCPCESYRLRDKCCCTLYLKDE
ncbi:MAG: hypothetical protein KBT04_04800 [Bacteroidales bacterium]|nr:hypothetical protein [Candidatus Colimorpha onthohippi]